MPAWFWLLIFVVLIGAFATYAYLSTKKAIDSGTTTRLMRFWAKDATKSIASSLVSIVLGLTIGCVILLVITHL